MVDVKARAAIKKPWQASGQVDLGVWWVNVVVCVPPQLPKVTFPI